MTDLGLYITEAGLSQTKLQVQEQSVWLTQLGVAELFGAPEQNISLHLKYIFEDGELEPAATVKKLLTVQAGFPRPATTEQCSVVQQEQTWAN